MAFIFTSNLQVSQRKTGNKNPEKKDSRAKTLSRGKACVPRRTNFLKEIKITGKLLGETISRQLLQFILEPSLGSIKEMISATQIRPEEPTLPTKQTFII